MVDALRKDGIKVVTYGREWEQHPDSHRYIEGNAMIDAINRAHLYIDLTNGSTALGHRIFESSCCGTPILTKRRLDTLKLFSEGNEILCYDGDFIPAVKRALKDKDQLRKIGLVARERCLKEHDISHRMKKLLRQIERKRRG
jgi:spore maturation protein CgeB